METKKMVLRSTPTQPRAGRTPRVSDRHRSPLQIDGPTPACSGADPGLFWPATFEDAGRAQALCRSCPLMAACYAAGVQGKEWGVWGGVLLERGRPSESLPGVTRAA